MITGQVRHGRWFDELLSIPLVTYLAVVVALVASVAFGVSREALQTALDDPALIHAVKLSLVTSAISTLLSLAVAIPAGYVLSRRRTLGALIADTIVDLPIVLPPLVLGMAVLLFFSTSVGRWIDRGIVERGIFVYQPAGIVLVQFIVGCAFAIRVLKAGFDGLDRRYEEVAMTLGAGRAQAFSKVALPNIGHGLVAAAVVSWARIFGLFGPVLLVCGTMRRRTEIMPTTIFLEMSIGRLEVALVVGAAMILISVGLLLLVKVFGTRGHLWGYADAVAQN